MAVEAQQEGVTGASLPVGRTSSVRSRGGAMPPCREGRAVVRGRSRLSWGGARAQGLGEGVVPPCGGDVHVEESDLKASVGSTIRVARGGGADVEDLHNRLITNKYKRFFFCKVVDTQP